MSAQFPEYRPRYSKQPTLASGCHGLPAEVTIGCGGGVHCWPRMVGNGETYSTNGGTEWPLDLMAMRASSRPSEGEWLAAKLATLGVLQSSDDSRVFESFHGGGDRP